MNSAAGRTCSRSPGVPLLLLCGLVVLMIWWKLRPSPDELVQSANSALDNGDSFEALRLAEEALRGEPDLAAALTIAGQAAENLGRGDEALGFYDRIRYDGTAESISGLESAGNLAVQMRRISDAERHFRALLAADPDHLLAHRRLAAILVVEGRRRESIPHLLELLWRQTIDVDELALLGNVEQVFDDEETVEFFREYDPDNPFLLLGLARIAMLRNDSNRAERLLREAIPDLPVESHLDVYVNYGKLLAESGTRDDFLNWHAGLPVESDAHPDVWSVRGEWAQRHGHAETALRCYWEAVRRDPNHWKANYQTAQLLFARGETARAAPFLERAQSLQQLAQTLKRVLLHPGNVSVEDLLGAARLTESLGRPREAWAWYSFAAAAAPDDAETRNRRDALRISLSDGQPQTLVDANPAIRIDLSHFPLPRFSSDPVVDESPLVPRMFATSARFDDLAQAAGLRFTYQSGGRPPELSIWQNLGGGVGVVDFDLDSWPDVYFTQGGELLRSGSGFEVGGDAADRLYRNLGSIRFEDVTEGAARVRDNGFGQGVTVGDVDGDGFPDLYVANIGRNHLWRNNGDGTFDEVGEPGGIDHEVWTTSCVLADLNGDALPDIYDVTYVAGDRPFEQVCHNEHVSGRRVSCAPTRFEAEQDVCFINCGDGTFKDVSERSGVLAADGKGLGVVAADFDGSGRLSVFVANDTTANFYFVNEGTLPGTDVPVFAERAVALGCALDSNGRAQACMGVACADVDGDGLLDLHVTNFLNEYNVLYSYQPTGLFLDCSQRAGVKAPSIDRLGFGCQFLDAELDGWVDLVIVNGHIDDYTEIGRPFRMRPQFFSNVGDGLFAEADAAGVGEYFRQETLGRSVARLDWNRDGREDFVASHLDRPASLLTNHTAPAGHFISVQLRGRQCSRDAIGAAVRVTCNGRVLTRQLTAGDGYFASNQRQLVFGLGTGMQIDELSVSWPSGAEQVFREVSLNESVMIVEGRHTVYPLP